MIERFKEPQHIDFTQPLLQNYFAISRCTADLKNMLAISFVIHTVLKIQDALESTRGGDRRREGR